MSVSGSAFDLNPSLDRSSMIDVRYFGYFDGSTKFSTSKLSRVNDTTDLKNDFSSLPFRIFLRHLEKKSSLIANRLTNFEFGSRKFQRFQRKIKTKLTQFFLIQKLKNDFGYNNELSVYSVIRLYRFAWPVRVFISRLDLASFGSVSLEGASRL